MSDRVIPARYYDRPRARWLAPRANGARLHAGVDLGATGAVVRAPEDGRVVVSGTASYGDDQPRWSVPVGYAGYGPQFVVIRGLSGKMHILGHIDRAVAVGCNVRAGDEVGSVHARGGHVHWEVRARNPSRDEATVEVAVDPIAWLEGHDVYYDASIHGCPPNPANDRRTPRACRPDPTPALVASTRASKDGERRHGQ